MELDRALAWLDAHQDLEADPAVAGSVEGLSLEPTEALLGLLGDPHRAYPVCIITGTNGKGSVARMLTSLLVAQGLSVGTYTSPHLEHLGERIRWNDRPIPDDELARVLSDLADREPSVGARLSWFELLTAAAYTWFADVAVDVAVVEVGLLGRWDATNVADAQVAVLTNVAGDHTDFGEGWRQRVADEKAGVIKPGAHVVFGEDDPSVVARIDAAVSAAGGTRWRWGDELLIDRNDLAVGGRVVSLRTPYGSVDDCFLPAHGRHQGTNALLALGAAEAFFGRALASEVVAEAFGSLELPGRLEVVHRRPLTLLDGAHNADAAAAVVGAIGDFGTGGARTLVWGSLAGRDPQRFLEAIDVGGFARVITTSVGSPRGLAARELAGVVAEAGRVAEVVDDPLAAVRRAVDGADEDGLVLVTGSLHLVGVVRAGLRW